MPKRKGIGLIVLGTVLILSALSLFLLNRRQDEEAGDAASEMLADVQSVIAARRTTRGATAPSASRPDFDSRPVPTAPAPSGNVSSGEPEAPAVAIGGYDVIGYLSIPSLDLALPIIAEWDEVALNVAPCRHFGSAATDDLVIAGHNYVNHFGALPAVQVGASVTFTDMDGRTYTYEVAELDTLRAADVEAVQQSPYELILYTCTYSGKTRATVFCRRVS